MNYHVSQYSGEVYLFLIFKKFLRLLDNKWRL